MTNPEIETIADLYNPHLYTASVLTLDGLLKAIGGYEIEVWDRLAENQAGILAPKHSGVADIPLVGVATKHVYNRDVRFVADQKLVQNYPLSGLVRSYFDHMGGIIFDQAKRPNLQPAGPQMDRDIANHQLLGVFDEGGISRGKDLATRKRFGEDVPDTRGVGSLAVRTLVPVQAVGMAGSESTLQDWLGRKHVVYGKVLYPERDEATYDPDNPRTWLRDARAFSREVAAMMQATNNRAHQLHSRKTVSFSGRRR